MLDWIGGMVPILKVGGIVLGVIIALFAIAADIEWLEAGFSSRDVSKRETLIFFSPLPLSLLWCPVVIFFELAQLGPKENPDPSLVYWSMLPLGISAAWCWLLANFFMITRPVKEIPPQSTTGEILAEMKGTR